VRFTVVRKLDWGGRKELDLAMPYEALAGGHVRRVQSHKHERRAAPRNVNGANYLKPLATSGIDAASANPIPAPRIFRLSARYRF
jgi:hypothetical protein